jgi:hypothetical protein
MSGLLLWRVGLPDRAVARLERALTVADKLRHPYSRAYAIWHAALLDLWRFDLSAMAARAETLHALATAHDYPIWRALAVVLRGTKMIADGEVEDGLVEVDRGFDLYDDQATPPVFWPQQRLANTCGALADPGLGEVVGRGVDAVGVVVDVGSTVVNPNAGPGGRHELHQPPAHRRSCCYARARSFPSGCQRAASRGPCTYLRRRRTAF